MCRPVPRAPQWRQGPIAYGVRDCPYAAARPCLIIGASVATHGEPWFATTDWCRHPLRGMSMVRVVIPHHHPHRCPDKERRKHGNAVGLLDERTQLLRTTDEMAQQPVRRRIIG